MVKLKSKSNFYKHSLKVIFGLVGSLFFVSCSEPPKIESSKGSNSELNAEAYDATKGWKEIERPVVSAFLLDEAGFKVNGTQVGLQDYLTYDTPVVTYFLPRQSDFVEILRCEGDVALTSKDGSLTNIEAASQDLESMTDALKDSNFWVQAEESGKCTLVASEFNISAVFHDETAASGPLIYLVRACVHPSRLADTKFLGTRNCSRQLGISSKMNAFVNKREERLISVLSEASSEKRKLDVLGREIYQTTVKLNNALFKCEKKESERKIRLARKTAISQIIGFGMSLGANIYAATSTLSSAKDVFKQVWESRNQTAGAANAISGTLMDLTASPDDFPKSCVEEEKYISEIVALSQSFKTSHLAYANLLDSVER